MQWAANLNRRLAFRRQEFTPTRKSPLTEYAAIALFYSVGQVIKNHTVFTIFSTSLINWKLEILNIKPLHWLQYCNTYTNKNWQIVMRQLSEKYVEKILNIKPSHCWQYCTSTWIKMTNSYALVVRELHWEMETYGISNVSSAYRTTCTFCSSWSDVLKTCATQTVSTWNYGNVTHQH